MVQRNEDLQNDVVDLQKKLDESNAELKTLRELTAKNNRKISDLKKEIAELRKKKKLYIYKMPQLFKASELESRDDKGVHPKKAWSRMTQDDINNMFSADNIWQIIESYYMFCSQVVGDEINGNDVIPYTTFSPKKSGKFIRINIEIPAGECHTILKKYRSKMQIEDNNDETFVPSGSPHRFAKQAHFMANNIPQVIL